MAHGDVWIQTRGRAKRKRPHCSGPFARLRVRISRTAAPSIRRKTIGDWSTLQFEAVHCFSGCFSSSFGSFGGFLSSFFGSLFWFFGGACAAGAGFLGASAGFAAGFSGAAGGGGLTAAGGFAGAGGLAASSCEFVFSCDGGGVNFFGGCVAPFVPFAVSGLRLAPASLFGLPAGGFTLLGCSAALGFEAL
jgi:hypothetical protein